jgi:hypothetical protein
MSPQRIQLSRAKGWRKPEGAIVVSRPSKWGNPWTVAEWAQILATMRATAVNLPPFTKAELDFAARDVAVACLADGIYEDREHQIPGWYPSLDEIRAELRGKDLACWCPLEDADGNRVPCHADVHAILSLAPEGEADE